MAACVDLLADFFTRLEMDGVLGLGDQFLTRFGVVSTAGWPEVQAEAAEATDLDAPPLTQGVAHLFDQRVDGKRNFFFRQPGEFTAHAGNQF